MVAKSCKKLQKVAKLKPKFFCAKCEYSTSRKSSYDKHLLTKKHLDKALPKCCVFEKKLQKSSENEYICEICEKEYKNRSGLWRHQKKCKKMDYSKEDMIKLLREISWTPDDVQNAMKLAGTTNNTNNISINVYLNEHCKDALNLDDFVKKIQLSVEDVLKTNSLGLEDGVSNVVIKELEDLSANKRPIHCVDKKRNKFYIKDNDEWKKEDAEKIIKAAEKIRIKHIIMLENWEKEHPNYLTLGHKEHTMWQHMVATFTKKITDKDKDRIVKAIKRRVMIKEAMGEIKS
tara:strand:+ start:4188 stop:5054 length:867 start_codon:yes stop_codon:yes gene_type:complete